jgi:hypothetical protein
MVAGTRSVMEPSTARRSRTSTTIANILISGLLGTISLLVAWFAFQSSTYGDEASRLASTANQMGVDSVRASQEDNAEHLSDIGVWVTIVQSGELWQQHPLRGLLSQRWLDAVDRAELIEPGFTTLPVDTQYWKELFADTEATRLAQATAASASQQASATSARLTGATVILSASLLLLTIASSGTRSSGVRIALAMAATVILVIALIVGAAPVRLPG